MLCLITEYQTLNMVAKLKRVDQKCFTSKQNYVTETEKYNYSYVVKIQKHIKNKFNNRWPRRNYYQ